MGFGTGGFVSGFIKFWTRPNWWRVWDWSPLSHWATILTLDERLIADLIARKLLSPPRIDQAPPRVVLIESTILAEKHGVQVNWASERVADYPGRVYLFPLSSQSQRRLNQKRFTDFMISCVGRPYDKVLIAHLLFDRFDLVPSREDWEAFVCSENGAASLKIGELLPANLNTSEVTPQRMAEFALWSDTYYQLKGKPKDVKKYNSRKADK